MIGLAGYRAAGGVQQQRSRARFVFKPSDHLVEQIQTLYASLPEEDRMGSRR